MLCLSLFPTFTPSNFVKVIDSSVPCALAFWLCFVTPHLYQLAWFQLGGLSNLKKKKTNPKPASLGALCHGFPLQCPLSPGPRSGHALVSLPPCSVQFIHAVPRRQWGAEGKAGTPRHEDGDRVRVSTPGSFCSVRSSSCTSLSLPFCTPAWLHVKGIQC